MDDDGLAEGAGELEGAAEGGELEVEGCGAKAIEPAFTDSDEVRIVAILVDDAFERGDTVGGEVPGMAATTTPTFSAGTERMEPGRPGVWV